MPTTPDRWTNKSVRSLAPGSDPIVFVVERARQATLAAIESGWTGPPFDPINLAKTLGIDVSPREDVPEARVLSNADGGFRIEYNPNRPRARVRYSIAHEIAHTFFPDCAERIRHRADRVEMSGDDWQLEMLCNIAAAELVMPIGSFPDLRERGARIDDLMSLRREYDVSIEAMLLRFIRLTPHPCALFAARRLEREDDNGRYRTDYAIGSASWGGSVPVGSLLPEGSVITECTAIGFTAKGDEVWPPQNHELHVECVGVPPYPGSSYPRVLGLMSLRGTHEAGPTVRHLAGDALEPRGDGPRIIAHVVNDKSATWGSGFARSLVTKFSQAQIDFRHWTRDDANFSLGKVHFCGSPTGIEIASMVAQHGFGPSSTPRIRYPALETCLAEVASRATAHRASVHMPKIGCGQAGGDWAIVSELIERTLVKSKVPTTVYSLPGQAAS